MTERRSLPLPPHELPALDALFHGGLWDTWTERDWVFPLEDLRSAVHYLRLKPNDSGRLVVLESTASQGDDPPRGFVLRLFSTHERAVEHHAKVSARPGTEDPDFPVFIDPEHAAVGVPFPFDPVLPSLRHVFDPDRFRRTLQSLLPELPPSEWRIKRRSLRTTVLAYKPERRAVFAVDFECRAREGDERVRHRIHAKLEEPREARRHFDDSERLTAALADALEAPVATPLGCLDERGFVATRWIDGDSVARRLELARDAEDPHEFLGDAAARAIGTTLGVFHELPVELEHLPSPIERGQRLLQLGDDMAALLPEHADRIRRLARQLAREGSQWASLASEPTHGDFHPGQVLLTDRGPTIVDLDSAGRGYPVDDVGNFIAYLVEAHADGWIEPFLDGYRARRPDASLSCLSAAIAIGLFLRLPAPLRRLDLDWPEQTERLLAEAERAMRGDSE